MRFENPERYIINNFTWRKKSENFCLKKLPTQLVSQGIEVLQQKRYLCHYSLSKYLLKPKQQGCVGIYEIELVYVGDVCIYK